MKEFFKMMFASMFGIILASFLMGAVLLIFLVIMVAAFEPAKETIPANSILHLRLNEEIKERGAGNNPFENFDFVNSETNQPFTLASVLNGINIAKNDGKIKGIFLDLDNIPTEFTILEELREALIDFKKSNKFIYSFSKYYTQKSYFIASISDSIFLYPLGDLQFKGLAAEVPYFKETLNKLEIEPIIIRHGKYKSAVEPFIQSNMSEENKIQIKQFLMSIWDYYLDCVSSARNISKTELNKIADNLSIEDANKAKEFKLVDRLVYRDEVTELLKDKSGIKKKSELKLVSLRKYLNSSNVTSTSTSTSNRIAVIYAVGNIIDGSSNGELIASETYAKLIKEARENEDIKAIVLRVNSGGGDGLASDVIYRELELTKGKKPIVVSMGSYAASGGYYISCLADKIVADNTTLTGSIGVFSMWFNFEKLFKNKLGISFEKVKTNSFSDFISANRTLSEYERKLMARQTDNFYAQFVEKVANGRNLKFTYIDSIAQGRIWVGSDAKKIGLVDTLGGIKLSLDLAAKLANISDFKVKAYPPKEQYFEKLLQLLSENNDETFLKNQLGENYKYFLEIKSLAQMKGIQARLLNKVIIE